MTRPELKELYVKACIRARTKPQKSEEDVWFKEFEYVSARDLEEAINSHFKQSEWMPKESVLRPMVEQVQRANALKCATSVDLVMWLCPDCGHGMSSLLPSPANNLERRCRSFYRRTHEQRPFDACLPCGQICGAWMNAVTVIENYTTSKEFCANEK